MRHVSAHAVERVMSTFGKMFLKGKSPVIPKISHDPETPATDSLQSLRGRTKQILNAIGGERLVNFSAGEIQFVATQVHKKDFD